MNFDKIKYLMDEAVSEHEVPCSDIMIVHKGEVVYRYMNGTIDDEKTVPIKGDEMYFLYSATKPITCTAAMQLVEAGKIKLEDKVSDYMPEFKEMWVKSENGLRKAEKPITIQNLFSMTSGMNYDLNNAGILKQREQKPDSSTLEMVRAMAEEPLEFEPGEHFKYSLSHDVLAAVVEVVSGMSFGEYLQKHIFDVCGMKRTGFTLNEEIKTKMCSQYIFDGQTGKVQDIALAVGIGEIQGTGGELFGHHLVGGVHVDLAAGGFGNGVGDGIGAVGRGQIDEGRRPVFTFIPAGGCRSGCFSSSVQSDCVVCDNGRTCRFPVCVKCECHTCTGWSTDFHTRRILPFLSGTD